MLEFRPEFKVVYDEFIGSRGDIKGIFNLYVHSPAGTPAHHEDVQLYETFSENYIKLALNKAKDYWSPYLKYWLVDEKLPVMFECNDQVYSVECMCLSQFSIVGSQIPGNKLYGEYKPEAEKFDMVRDYVFTYQHGTALVKSNQLFLNGELLCNAKQLKELCDSINQDFNKLDYYPDNLMDYLKKTYKDDFDCYVCQGYSSYNVKEGD